MTFVSLIAALAHPDQMDVGDSIAGRTRHSINVFIRDVHSTGTAESVIGDEPHVAQDITFFRAFA